MVLLASRNVNIKFCCHLLLCITWLAIDLANVAGHGMHFTLEPSTSGRVLAPVPTLLATHSRGNHGGIAPTKIGEPTPMQWILSNRLRSVV